MNRIKTLMVVVAALSLAVPVMSVQAQRRYGYRTDERRVKDLLERIEDNADRFQKSLDDALDRSRLDGSRAEDDINKFVKDFEKATDRLKDRFDDNRSSAREADEVLKRASTIDRFMRRHRLTQRAQSDWRRLRGDLSQLARIYNARRRW